MQLCLPDILEMVGGGRSRNNRIFFVVTFAHPIILWNTFN